MTLTMAIKGIIALSKIVPSITKAFNMFSDMWINHKINQIDIKRITNQDKRIALMNAIKGAQSNEERKALSIMLHQFNTGSMPNAKR